MAPRSGRVNPQVQTRGAARSFVESLDTYYQPARDRRKEEAFQRGLSQWSSVFEEEAARVQKERQDQLYQEGLMDQQREAAGEELKGVQTGGLFRQNSRYYQMGLNEARGRAAGIKWKSDLAVEFEQSGIDATKDPEAYRAWMDQKTNEFLSQFEGNQYAMDGALPHVNEAVQNLSYQYSTRLNEQLRQEHFDAFDLEIANIFDSDFRGEVDRQTAIDALAAATDEMKEFEGGTAANDALVDSAIQYALKHEDPEALQVLAEGFDQGKLRLSGRNQKKLKDAVDTLEAQLRAADSRMSAQEKERQRAVNEQIMVSFSERLSADPTTPMPTYAEVVAQGGNYEAFVRIKNIRDTFDNAAGGSQRKKVETEAMWELQDSLDQAETTAQKERVLREWTTRYPGVLTPEQLTKRINEFREEEDVNAAMDGQLKEYRNLFVDDVGMLVEENYSKETTSHVANHAKRVYTAYLRREKDRMISEGLTVEEMHTEAKEYAVEQLNKTFPDRMAQGYADKPGVGKVVGGQPEPPKPIWEDEPVEGAEEETLMETPEETEEVTEQALENPEEESFYATLLNSFTDGVDERPRPMELAKVFTEDPEFAREVETLADDLGFSAYQLGAVMSFETGGTFDPAELNKAGSGATGLIQFMPATARGLGTTTDELAGMSRVEQMKYVRKYFNQWKGRMQKGDINDLYMAVLWPAAIGKPDDYVIFRSGTEAYRQNAKLDRNGDGTVTKWEAAYKVRQKYYGQQG